MLKAAQNIRDESQLLPQEQRTYLLREAKDIINDTIDQILNNQYIGYDPTGESMKVILVPQTEEPSLSTLPMDEPIQLTPYPKDESLITELAPEEKMPPKESFKGIMKWRQNPKNEAKRIRKLRQWHKQQKEMNIHKIRKLTTIPAPRKLTEVPKSNERMKIKGAHWTALAILYTSKLKDEPKLSLTAFLKQKFKLTTSPSGSMVRKLRLAVRYLTNKKFKQQTGIGI